ncbi:PTH11-like integral membrane protein [Aspergillus karnatakaensis]|uniref:PTH11-like integral membrane protein n=1 Tax=Aspergillus karnatakaensis TaxID=1810916 RepID=UPI003CCCCC18
MGDILEHTLLPRDSDEGASRGQRAMVVTAVLTGISAVIVAMRIYTRVGLIKLSGREDWTILVSLAFAIVYLGLVISQYNFGMGRHSYDIPADELQKQLKRLWAAIPIYNSSLAFTKISLLFQYLRIFPSYRFCIICYVVLGIVIVYSTWAIVSGFVNCVPVAKFWDRELPGSCLSFEAVWFFNASMNIATDLTLLILPMPHISQLRLPLRQKIALVAVFALGGLVVITSILRLSSLRAVASSNDTSWSNVAAAYWTAAECNVAIICACLPFLRPLISRIFPKILSTNSYNKDAINPSRTTAPRSTRQRALSDPYSRDPEFGLLTIDTMGQAGEVPDENNVKTSGTGLEVTPDMIREARTASCGGSESTSHRRLIVDD